MLSSSTRAATRQWQALSPPTLVGLLALFMSATSGAAGCTGDGKAGGILQMDRCDEFNASGISSRTNQKRLDAAIVAGTVGVALWEGTDSVTGRTAWKALDSMAMAAAATEVLKNVVQRPRPAQSSDPNLWRQGAGNKSFPSGETAMVSAFVTPIIMDYQAEFPAVWGLAVLPVYMAQARLGSQAHWLSDVLVGGAIGVATGYYAGHRDSPLLLAPLHNGVFVGFRHRF